MMPFPAPVHRVRVRYCETDRMAIAHHGSYVAWFEEARTEWLRARGNTIEAGTSEVQRNIIAQRVLGLAKSY